MSEYWLGVLTIPAATFAAGALAWSVIGITNLIDEVKFFVARRRDG